MKWCEVFRTGKHTDANGEERDWTREDLDKIVSKFHEKQPSAPIVIGHPKANNPAYGWVEDLKREGEILYASYKQVCNEFKEWVNKGRYKNRSISLYPDFTLRHIGFLGAMPPAVKGLAEYQFSEGEDCLIYDYSESASDFKFMTIASIFDNLRDFLIDKFDLDTANQVISSWKIEDLKQIETSTKEEVRAFCKTLANKGKETTVLPEGTQKNPNEFSAELEAQKQKIADLETQLNDEKKLKRFAEFEQFANEQIAIGAITPAQKDFVINFQEICHTQGNYDFAEGEEKSCLKRFQDFVKGIKQIDFSETANNGNRSPKPKDNIDFNDPKAVADAIVLKKQEYAAQGKNISEAKILNELKNNA